MAVTRKAVHIVGASNETVRKALGNDAKDVATLRAEEPRQEQST